MKFSIVSASFFIVCLWNLNLSAQTTDSLGNTKIDFSVLEPEIRFSSKNEFGFFLGIGHLKGLSDYPVYNSDLIYELTSTNGIQYGSFFAGIGTGIRYWGNDFLVPLFLHLSIDLSINRKIKGFFLCADLGNQFGTRQSNSFGDKETGNFFATYGLGYQFPVSKQLKLYLKTTLCHQKTKAAGDYSGLGPSTYQESYDPTYLFFRVSLGLKFTK
jgi:hypothetical protein